MTRRTWFGAFLTLMCSTMLAFAAQLPTVTNAEDGIFKAFQTHPLVGIREAHGLAQELDFYSALLRDPRFATEVGNVVLETGDAAYQNTVDRYVSGEHVPYAELRKVWADTIGFSPTVFSVGSINVYDTVRSVNMRLPPNQRIKIWLGDPPTDWSKIKTKADLSTLDAQRDSYPAGLIEREILTKNKKALVIYGAGHLATFVDKNNPYALTNLFALVNKAHPDAFFVVMPYIGYATPACAARFENHIKDWPTPSLITPIRGSSLEEDMLQPGCGPVPGPPSMAKEQFDLLLQDYIVMNDGLLYLGPRDKQLCSPAIPDIYLDLDFRAELERRKAIRSAKPIVGFTAHENTAVPQPFWPTGQCLFQP
jgi:hypothetical protein